MRFIIMYVTAMRSGYLNSVLRYEFLILAISHPDILHLRKKGCKNATRRHFGKQMNKETKLRIHYS